MAAIGIDLGTTYSCVAVWRNGRIEIIPNDQGSRTTPSWVAFTESENLVGQAAKNQVARNLTNTVFDSKRLIGRRFSHPSVKNDMKLWPFQVVRDSEDKPLVVVQFEGKEKRLSPEEISSMVLKKMKETAETFLGGPVKEAVVTVPAYFNNSQRLATKEAGAMAGLNVIRIINEPTAAAMAYFHDKKYKVSGEHNVLVFDLGGGTLDVSLVRVGGGKFEVKATAGDTHLGGEDFDNRLLRHFVDEIKRKQKKDISGDAKNLRKLKSACELAKEQLSFRISSVLELGWINDDADYIVTRAKFEDLCKDLFSKCIGPIEKCLAYANIEKSEVQEVVLVGGSSRIPKVKQLVSTFFDGKDQNMSLNGDEAVAYGAAVMAAKLRGEGDQIIRDLTVVDVTPVSFGIELIGGRMGVQIPRNTPIPIQKETEQTTAFNDQTAMRFEIYEGEGLRCKRNNRLGTLQLNGIPPAPRGKAKVNVCFEIDANGILHVSAENRTAGLKNQITIAIGTSSNQDIDMMVEEAEKFKGEDMELNDRIQSLCDYMSTMKEKVGKKLDEKKIEKAIDNVTRWLVADNGLSVAEVDAKFGELKEIVAKFSELKNIRNLSIK